MFGCEASARGRLDLAAEPLDDGRVAQQVAADDLEGDRPVHQPMLGPVDGTHAAGAEGGDDPVARVVVQLLGEPGDGRRVGGRVGEVGWSWRAALAFEADDERRRDLEARRRLAADSFSVTGAGRRGAAAAELRDQRVLRLVADPLATRVAGGQVFARSRPSPARRAGPVHRPTGGRQEGGRPRYPSSHRLRESGARHRRPIPATTAAGSCSLPNYQRECPTGEILSRDVKN